jgi:hypothetical protein
MSLIRSQLHLKVKAMPKIEIIFEPELLDTPACYSAIINDGLWDTYPDLSTALISLANSRDVHQLMQPDEE